MIQTNLIAAIRAMNQGKRQQQQLDSTVFQKLHFLITQKEAKEVQGEH